MGRAVRDGHKLHQKRFHLNMTETFTDKNSRGLEPSQGRAPIAAVPQVVRVRNLGGLPVPESMAVDVLPRSLPAWNALGFYSS